MEIKAKILEIFDEVKVSASFRKREFVVEYAENIQYPEYIKFELIQDKCDFLNNFEPGQNIIIHFNLKGRKWINPKGEAVYFNSLQAWKLVDAEQNKKGKADFDDEHPPLGAYSEEEMSGEGF